MPDNGSGTYSPPAGTRGTSGATIESSKQNAWVDDVAAALTNRIAKDGQTTYTANQPMGGNKLTNLAVGSSASDSARFDQTVTSVMTTRGDIVTRGASAPGRLAVGASGAVLGSDGTDPVWVTNVAKTDANSNFTADQTITHASSAVWTVTVTGGASGTLNAGPSAISIGSGSNHNLQIYTNNTPRFIVTATGSFKTSGLADPATTGGINAASLEIAGKSVQSVESSEYAVTPAAQHVYAHGLGVVPKNVWLTAVCQTAEYGYSIGDEVPVSSMPSFFNGGLNYGVSVVKDATNVTIRIGSTAFTLLVRADNGTGVAPTTANWKIKIGASGL